MIGMKATLNFFFLPDLTTRRSLATDYLRAPSFLSVCRGWDYKRRGGRPRNNHSLPITVRHVLFLHYSGHSGLPCEVGQKGQTMRPLVFSFSSPALGYLNLLAQRRIEGEAAALHRLCSGTAEREASRGGAVAALSSVPPSPQEILHCSPGTEATTMTMSKPKTKSVC